jgi:hypothetical protein
MSQDDIFLCFTTMLWAKCDLNAEKITFFETLKGKGYTGNTETKTALSECELHIWKEHFINFFNKSHMSFVTCTEVKQ